LSPVYTIGHNQELTLPNFSFCIKVCYCDKHQVMYRTVESLYCTPETNITVYVILRLKKKKTMVALTYAVTINTQGPKI